MNHYSFQEKINLIYGFPFSGTHCIGADSSKSGQKIDDLNSFISSLRASDVEMSSFISTCTNIVSFLSNVTAYFSVLCFVLFCFVYLYFI